LIATLRSRDHDEFFVALDKFLRRYNAAGFVIKKIHADGEFKPMMDRIKDGLDCEVNHTTAGEHVPVAERNNKTIKECVRVGYHRLPFKHMPKELIQELAITSTDQLNFFPVKGGISSYYSPRMIMKQENLDYEKHCSIPFGSFVQAEYEIKKLNTPQSRRKDAIYLRPVQIDQGGHMCMDIHTGYRFQTHKVMVLPMTQVIINAVNALGRRQGMQGLKFESRHGIIMQDADWIAGVDYDDYNLPEDHQDTDSDSDDEEYDLLVEDTFK
jgi:hypothetical protein